MKLLLHTCCGPCYLGVWEDFKGKDLEITHYFYNPNIYPEEEHERRLENLRKVVASKSALVEENYEPEKYEEMYEGLDSLLQGNDESESGNDKGERCLGCYRLRLEKTADYAKNHGFDAFSTTLLVSPYQKHEILKSIGVELANKYGVQFYYTDWRPHFRAGQDEAKEMELYRQKYCGCKYSLADK